jgi:isoamylase
MSIAPLGVQVSADGADFAVFSSVAEAVDLCLFDEQGQETRQPLTADEGYVWRGHVAGVGHGVRYGFRVHGPWDPAAGLRCNPAKLLLDPYTRAVSGTVQWDPAVHAEDPSDSAPYVPRSVVCANEFDWAGDASPGRPLADSIVYELHVKGFTRLHPGVPEQLRGTYAGLAHPAALEHLTRLGVTAIELLPTHQFVHDEPLVARGLRNYWGYQSIGYFAPHNEYSASGDLGGQVDEFKAMVKAVHEAGLEVILDVVYNHTAEGNEHGPTLCFRGLDNAAYYRLQQNRGWYVDDTGCGNTLDVHQPQALRLVMDSLRYWVQEMHVDGFRFDLAASLGRGASDFDPFSSFLETIGQDPVLSQVKLIAEPWDVGMGGYELGDFPAGWSEWNGRYRDTVRDFWRGVDGTLGDFTTRITGSSDLYGRGRRPTSSVNFITAHDGFTLNDLVSYDRKHNEANGEDNHDGTDDNRSWNGGAEGRTRDPHVLDVRSRQRRNFLATLMLSEGVPMLVGGDELGRTQQGNNNAYCQDNETSWLDWAASDSNGELVEFVAHLCRLRHENPVFRRRRFFAQSEVDWFRPDGEPVSPSDWANPASRAVTMGLPEDDSFLMMVNGWWEPLRFQIPARSAAAEWRVVVDTAQALEGRQLSSSQPIELAGRSLILLQRLQGSP